MVSRTGESIEVPIGDRDIGSALVSFWAHLKTLLWETALFAGGIGWIAAWAVVARLNFANGNGPGAAVIALVFVLPALGLLLWRLRGAMDAIGRGPSGSGAPTGGGS